MALGAGAARDAGAASRSSSRCAAWASLLRDPAFLRLAVCVGASQCAAVALQTLWIATWLRDVAGWNPAEVARGLLAVNVAMVRRLSGVRPCRRRLAAPRPQRAAAARGGRCFVLAQPRPFDPRRSLARAVVRLRRRRHRGRPRLLDRGAALSAGMAGRINTAVNVIGFVGMFAGQWGIGAVLSLWPPHVTNGSAAMRRRLIPGRSAWSGRSSSPASPGCGRAGGFTT